MLTVTPVELVTVSAHGVQVLRGFRIALDLATEPADINREEVAGKLGIVAPDRFEELVAVERAPAVAGEGALTRKCVVAVLLTRTLPSTASFVAFVGAGLNW